MNVGLLNNAAVTHACRHADALHGVRAMIGFQTPGACLFSTGGLRGHQSEGYGNAQPDCPIALDLVDNNFPNVIVTKSRLFTPLFEKEGAGEI